jgi:hypothetical protein
MKEDDLVAYYLTHQADGRRAFPAITDHDPKKIYMFERGYYDSLINHPSYIARKFDNRISYLWDSMIRRIADNLLAGRIKAIDGVFNIHLHQTGVQLMAAEPRNMRRIYSQCIAELWSKAYKSANSMRAMLPDRSMGSQDTAYLYMIFGDMHDRSETAYVQYRERRVQVLKTHCIEILRRFPQVKQIVGIATEPWPLPGGCFVRTEDLIVMEQFEWTAEADRVVKNAFESTGIKYTTDKRSTRDYSYQTQ